MLIAVKYFKFRFLALIAQPKQKSVLMRLDSFAESRLLIRSLTFTIRASLGISFGHP